MKQLVWRNIGRFVLLMLIQLLVLSHVYLGSYIMPMLYLLFILMLPTGMKRIPLLLIAFGTGLLADTMNQALGFHALACTVVAMMRIWFADRIITRGEPVTIEQPSIRSVTPQYFIAYLLLMFAIFYVVLFGFELLTFRGFWAMMAAVVMSSLAATALSVLYQLAFIKKTDTAS